MSTLKSNVIEPATGTNLTLGASGDLIDVPADALQLNSWKDSGGNTLFTSDGSGNLSSINSALDIGGGPGVYLHPLKNRVTSYYLIDISVNFFGIRWEKISAQLLQK